MLRVRSVHPRDDAFRIVKQIRHRAYGAHLPIVPPSCIADEFDDHATCILVFELDEPIATLRVCLRPDQKPFDYQLYPEHARAWPELATSVTLSRVAAVPHVRGKGILRMLCSIAAEAARRAGRMRVLAGAAMHLIPAYVDAGWQRSGVQYASKLGSWSEMIHFEAAATAAEA